MPLVAGSVNLFDGVWRAMLDRVYDELAHVHTLYAGALRKEQQEKEVFRAHCIRLKGERQRPAPPYGYAGYHGNRRSSAVAG
jgi:hypothetical protein